MPHSNFVHLRVHSAYSLSEGALKIPQLIDLTKEFKMPAVAITDNGNLFGALEFAITARKNGVQPIIGCELSVVREGVNPQVQKKPARDFYSEYDQLVLLVQNRTGYENLISLASKAYLQTPTGEHPRIQMDWLIGNTSGLIALTGGPCGSINRLLEQRKNEKAIEKLEQLKELFTDRLYIELMRHGVENEYLLEEQLIELAYQYEIPLVATNNCYFSDESMYEAHDALLCIAQSVHVATSERRRLTPSHCFRSPKEMQKLFKDIPEALDNTVTIAQRCSFMPEEHVPILPVYPLHEGKNETEELRIFAKNGLNARLGLLNKSQEEKKVYHDRLDFELSTITQMGFPGYFLIVADFIRWAKEQKIPVGPGRGSGAGSVTAWALTITDLDPLRFGLLFERFLNPERVSMPDFDIDFCQERRDEVIKYVQEKYGANKVAQIITFGKLQARAVLRDVGRVLGIPYGYVDKICKLIPFNPAKPPTLEQALKEEPELCRLREEDEQVEQLLDIGMKLEGLYRHASTHAAGVVIGDRPLDKLVPLYRDPRSDMAATQFSMKYAEAAGLVKFDFLGLKTLTVLERAVGLLREKNIDVTLSDLPLDDEITFKMLSSGETVGVFQLESSGMRDVLRQLRPDKFEDIIALVALYRPGPMDNIPRYIACKHGTEKPDYLHPQLQDILQETFGVMIYQEQVMQIAQKLSGFSLGSADLLRRAMGKKIKSEMEAQRQSFVDGAVERGVARDQAERIFQQVDKFAGYGFNKSHAAAYALLAYQTAWLKANHPVEFFAASMTLDLGNTEKLSIFRQELERLAIDLLPPHINFSQDVFSVEHVNGKSVAIRYALTAIKNVGLQAMQALVENRKKNGSYASPFDFVERLGARAANKRMLENLILAGALDCLKPNRRQLFNEVDKLIKTANAAEREKDSTQENLFEGGISILEDGEKDTDINDWSPLEKLKYEFDAVGFYLSAHPLDIYGQSLKKLGIVSFDQLSMNAVGGSSKLAGVVIHKQERTSARGNRFAFLQVSGINGIFEVTLFSEILAQSREVIGSGKPLLFTCETRTDASGALRLTVLEIKELDKALASIGSGIKINVKTEEALTKLRKTITNSASGKGRIRLILDVGEADKVELALADTYEISAELRASIESLPGIASINDM